MDLNDLLTGLLSELNKVSKSDAVVGKVRDAGKAKVVPLSKISIAFGAGMAGAGGKKDADEKPSDAGIEGGGAGGALVVEPKAFVVVGEDGVPHMLALNKGKHAVLRKGLEILPEATKQLAAAAAPKLGDGKKK
ncbi:MAG: hypothetical protein IPI67_18505 [Myxococcales bacterium]|nr:hypothetical protein [Myxococcales bacterium]